MNAPHLHLLVNHAPVFASVFALLFLVWALIRRTGEVRRLALASVVLMALATLPAYFTGEPAEEVMEHVQGIDEDRLEEHEEAAQWALIGGSIAGLVALGLLFAFRRREFPTLALVLVLLIDLWVVAIFTRVATLGGEIRHPEIRAGWTPTPHDSGGDH